MEWKWNGNGMPNVLFYKDSSIIPLFIDKKCYKTKSCQSFFDRFKIIRSNLFTGMEWNETKTLKNKDLFIPVSFHYSSFFGSRFLSS